MEEINKIRVEAAIKFGYANVSLCELLYSRFIVHQQIRNFRISQNSNEIRLAQEQICYNQKILSNATSSNRSNETNGLTPTMQNNNEEEIINKRISTLRNEIIVWRQKIDDVAQEVEAYNQEIPKYEDSVVDEYNHLLAESETLKHRLSSLKLELKKKRTLKPKHKQVINIT